jgi:hypothetical protein
LRQFGDVPGVILIFQTSEHARANHPVADPGERRPATD